MADRSTWREFIKTDRGILVACIVIAFVFWLFTKLSQRYEIQLALPLSIIEPEGQLLRNKVPESITARISATGWELLNLRNRVKGSPLQFDMNNEPKRKSVNNSELILLIKNYYPNVDIISISPSDFDLEWERQIEKRVPVRHAFNISVAPEHHLISSPSLSPEEVLISGPASIIAKIDTAYTTALELQALSAPSTGEVSFDTRGQNIIFTPATVKYSIPVEALTEKTMMVDIKAINVPEHLNARLFPQQVKLTCIVGVGVYDLVKPEQFSVCADFKQVYKVNEKFQVPLFLADYPVFLKNDEILFSPQAVMYLFEEKRH